MIKKYAGPVFVVVFIALAAAYTSFPFWIKYIDASF